MKTKEQIEKEIAVQWEIIAEKTQQRDKMYDRGNDIGADILNQSASEALAKIDVLNWVLRG